MTGKDLILYILQNNLENEPVFKDGKIIGFYTIEEAAVEAECGTATIKAWIKTGRLSALKLGETYLIPKFGEVHV